MTTRALQCQHCREDIRQGAKVCPHCRRAQPGSAKPVLKFVLIGGAVLIVGFIIMAIIGSNIDDSPEARVARITASCDKQYGPDTYESRNCQIAIMMAEIKKSQDRKLEQAVKDAR